MADRSGEDTLGSMCAFVQRSRPRLLRLLARLRIPEMDREDLLQDALVELVIKWQGIERPEFWVLGTLRNKCSNYTRGRQRSRSKVVVVSSIADLELLAGPAPKLDHATRLDLARLAQKLPARQRRVLRLFYGLGLNERELSACTPAAARESLHKDRWRAIRQLRLLLVGNTSAE
jgi:RNA polymerase sigma factor (sigma-70 family)